jgi:hypothetical protein
MDGENYLVLKNPNIGNLKSILPASVNGFLNKLDITKDIHLIDITGIEGNSHYYLPNG